jgi:hypothetical protein
LVTLPFFPSVQQTTNPLLPQIDFFAVIVICFLQEPLMPSVFSFALTQLLYAGALVWSAHGQAASTACRMLSRSVHGAAPATRAQIAPTIVTIAMIRIPTPFSSLRIGRRVIAPAPSPT